MRQTISVVTILPLAVLLVTAAGGYGQDNQAPFSIKIDTPASVVEAGAKIRISVLLTNTSTHTIGLYFSNSRDPLLEEYRVHVYDAANRHRKMSKYAWKLSGMKPAADDKNDYSDYKDDFVMMESGGYGPLEPGTTRESRLDLSDAYTLDSPGKYTVWVSRVDPASKLTVRSNTITLTVTGQTK
jgi:hypothetical protein